MSALWQTIIGGLAVAMVSGLTIIAYRHPAGYRRIYTPLICTILVVWLAWMIYELGVSQGSTRALLETMKLNSGQVINTPPVESFPWWVGLVTGVAVGYFGFLRLLPEIIGTQEKETYKK